MLCSGFTAAGAGLVLALGDLQIEGGALAVHHNRSRVEQLLARAIVAGKAVHHPEGKEELYRQRAGAIGNVDYAAEIDTVEVRIWGEIIQYRSDQM